MARNNYYVLFENDYQEAFYVELVNPADTSIRGLLCAAKQVIADKAPWVDMDEFSFGGVHDLAAAEPSGHDIYGW